MPKVPFSVHSNISGGHPHNWTRISSECLALIASFTDRLVAHRERAANGISRERKLLEEDKKDKDGKKPKGTKGIYPF